VEEKFCPQIPSGGRAPLKGLDGGRRLSFPPNDGMRFWEGGGGGLRAVACFKSIYIFSRFFTIDVRECSGRVPRGSGGLEAY
jgi:hypothetical protein